MQRLTSLDLLSVLRDTVYSKNQPKGVEQIADDLAWNKESIYKALNSNEGNYNFPLKRLVPLIKSTCDLRLLYHIIESCEEIIRKNGDIKWLHRIANLMGCEVVQIKGRMGTKKELDSLPRKFGEFHDVLTKMYKEKIISDEEHKTVHRFLSLAMGQVKVADKVHNAQLSLGIGGE